MSYKFATRCSYTWLFRLISRKCFDFEISTYLYFLRSPKFIYAIFEVMYICMCASVCMSACMCVCMWMNTIASKRCIRLSSNLVHILQVTVGRNLLIWVNIGWIVFFTGEQKRIFIHYDLWTEFHALVSFWNYAFSVEAQL